MSQPPARARKRATATKDATSPPVIAPQVASRSDHAIHRRIVAASAGPQPATPAGGRKPLWQKLADDLRARIESGQLAPGDLIPSEADLTAAHGVSRPTARLAVSSLRSAGLVVTEHGRGTRVRPSLISAPTTTVVAFNPTVIHEANTSMFTTWEDTGWTETELSSLYRATVGAHAPLLRLSPGEPVFVYERRLEHASTARVLHRLFLPFALTVTVASLETEPEVRPAQLYQRLSQAGYSVRWNDTVRAEMPTPDDSLSLDIPEGVPLLIHTRVTLAADDRPLALEETRLPADRASILTRPVQ